MDYIINENEEAVLIEVNSIPGLSPASIVPQQLASRNWSLEEVLSTLAEEHMTAHKEKNS
jgi:D-alanine-D-alanine ligase